MHKPFRDVIVIQIEGPAIRRLRTFRALRDLKESIHKAVDRAARKRPKGLRKFAVKVDRV